MPEAPALTALSYFENEPLRNVKALEYSGIFSGEQQTEAQIVTRLNRALSADFSGSDLLSAERKAEFAKAQADIRKQLETKPYAEVIDSKAFTDLVDRYMALLEETAAKKLERLDHGKNTLPSREERNATFLNKRRKEVEEDQKKYALERKYYAENPEKIRDIARRFEAAVRDPRYLSVNDVVVESGIAGDKDFARDLVGNVQVRQAVRSMLAVSAQFNDDATIREYEATPADNAVRVAAMAERLAGMTRAPSSFSAAPFLPEVDRIEALRDLVSAQLHYAMMQERPPEQMIVSEHTARDHVAKTLQVMATLAHDFLKTGPSAADPRTQALLADFEKEMQSAGVTFMDSGEAAKAAAQLSRQAAEDLLQVQVMHGDARLEAQIKAQAQAAGVDIAAEPLTPKSHLIDEELIEIIRETLKKKNVIRPTPEQLSEVLTPEQQRQWQERLRQGQAPQVALGA